MIAFSDIDIAARTVWAEARGEPYEGQLAVAHVLINRLNSNTGQFRRDDTLATTCLRHLQFSAWNKGDDNFEKLQSIGVENGTFRLALRAVLEALDGPDMTAGATHYHAASIFPSWAEGHEPSLVVGNHIFYQGIL
jgi:N-acetylmuramoyl-L-alanine amidase